MTVEKFKGFVLHHTPLTASREIVTFFTETGGKRKGTLRLTKKQGRAYLAPLTCLRFQLAGKEQQELKRIGELSLEHHHFDFAADYLGLTFLEHWAFLVLSSQPEEHEDERVFRLLDHCLKSFDGPNPPAELPLKNLYFEAWLLHFCGMLPRRRGPVRAEGCLVSAVEASEPGETRHGRSLDTPLMRQIFQVTIEDLVGNRLKLGSLTKTYEVLGKMWEQFLAKQLKTRTLLVTRFKERRLM